MESADVLPDAGMQSSGLLPGQAWKVPVSKLWQCRLDANGRAFMIGLSLARHPEYMAYYPDLGGGGRAMRPFALGGAAHIRRLFLGGPGYPPELRPRRWRTFRRACRVATFHNRLIIAAAAAADRRAAEAAGKARGAVSFCRMGPDSDVYVFEDFRGMVQCMVAAEVSDGRPAAAAWSGGSFYGTHAGASRFLSVLRSDGVMIPDRVFDRLAAGPAVKRVSGGYNDDLE